MEQPETKTMNAQELKKELLATIETSGMQTLFPKFCGAFHEMIEQTESSESDAELMKLFTEIFRNPDEWLAYLAEQPHSTK